MTAIRRQALVIGGTRGVGRAVVRRLAREGHAVIAVYRGDEAARVRAEGECVEAGLDVGFERADLTQPDQFLALFQRLALAERLPELLVNALGVGFDASLAVQDEAPSRTLPTSNLEVMLLTSQQAVKAMAPRGFGRIINVLSSAALLAEGGRIAHAAVQAGVLGLTRALAKEVGQFAITVNAVTAGIVRTDPSTPLSERQLELIQKTPLKRGGTPDEVAGLVNMLCADEAAYITGQCLSIDGGLS